MVLVIRRARVIPVGLLGAASFYHESTKETQAVLNHVSHSGASYISAKEAGRASLSAVVTGPIWRLALPGEGFRGANPFFLSPESVRDLYACT